MTAVPDEPPTGPDDLSALADITAIENHRAIVHNADNSDATRQRSRDALCKLILK